MISPSQNPRELSARLDGLGPIVAVAIVAGALLRLSFPTHVHFLGDEAWTLAHARDALAGGGWPVVGMPSSRNVPNAGASIWVFILLGAATDLSTPVGMTRLIALMSVAALVAMVALAVFMIDDARERRVWLWAAVLAASNPTLVFLSRDIWAQSVLPLFQILMILAWMRRGSRAGAFGWGLLGASLGQIHLAGFFFAAPLAATTYLVDRGKRATRWGSWLLGSMTGALAAVPWVLHLARTPSGVSSSPWWLRFRLDFYRFFFTEPTSLTAHYLVGKDVLELMRYPLAFGRPTYLVLLAHVALLVASLAVGASALARVWARRRRLGELLLEDRSPTGLLVLSTLVGMGLLFTLPSLRVHRHYLLACYPVPWLWTARAALRSPTGGRWLLTLFAGGLVVSLGIHSFVVANGGAAEFGMSWAAQVRGGVSVEDAKDFRR